MNILFIHCMNNLTKYLLYKYRGYSRKFYLYSLLSIIYSLFILCNLNKITNIYFMKPFIITNSILCTLICIVHCTMYIYIYMHCTIHSVQCMYIIKCAMYNVQYIVHCILKRVHRSLR